MNGTLPLFQELADELVHKPESSSGGQSGGSDPPPPAATGPSPATPARDRHLRAAWRLSRAMKRLPDGSVEQTRAGLAICRHLQALLAESDAGA